MCQIVTLNKLLFIVKYLTVLLLLYSVFVLQAAPTESREWESSTGSKMQGVALEVVNATVHLQREGSSKVLKLPMTKLSAADQAFLVKHFELSDAEMNPKSYTSKREAASGFPVELGVEKTVPIVVEEGISYRLYIPKSMKSEAAYPLLYYTSSGGGKQRIIDAMIKGAEINQWIVATPVESSNRSKNNGPQIQLCFEHILRTIPIDQKRIYFIGGSGGARRAFSFSDSLRKHRNIKPAGLISIVAGYTNYGFDKNICHYYINGGTDFNRYESAHSYNATGKKSVIRIHPGKHEVGPHIMITEAMTFLNGMTLKKLSGKEYSEMRSEYVASVIDWINQQKSTEPFRAYYWAKYLSDYKVDSVFRKEVSQLTKELAADKTNLDYLEGLEAITKFVSDEFPKVPMSDGSKMSFNDPKSSAKAKRLAEKYQHVPWVHDCFMALSSKTGKLGK